MVVIHKEKVSIPVPTMKPGAVFFDRAGRLMMVTDDIDAVDGGVSVVHLKTGTIHYFKSDEIAKPLKIVTVEVE